MNGDERLANSAMRFRLIPPAYVPFVKRQKNDTLERRVLTSTDLVARKIPGHQPNEAGNQNDDAKNNHR